MLIEPYIFTTLFQKTYKPTLKPTMYTNLVTYTRATIVLFYAYVWLQMYQQNSRLTQQIV